MVLLILFLLLVTSSLQAYPEVWEKVQSYELHRNKIVAEPLKININTADKEMLQKLTGIGPKRAQDIINYRQQQGSFKKIDDLQKIKGFTKKYIVKFWENNKDMVLF